MNDITKGELFSEKNVGMRRPGNGLEPIMIEKILGQKAKQKIPKGKLITFNDLEIKNVDL